jgi:hypothetical protein
MLGMALDAGVMYGIITVIMGETPEFLTALLVSFGFALTLGLAFFSLGLLGGLAAAVLLAGVFGAILSFIYGAPLKSAILGSLVFLGYKVGISFALAAITS